MSIGLTSLTPFALATPLSTGPPENSLPLVTSYPDPEPCYGNCTYIHDPSIWYEDGVYWRFSTNGNIAIATAPSLKGPWNYQGAMLPKGSKIKLREDQEIWAPSISKFGDTYYCHYAVSYLYSQHSDLGVATSKSLDLGTWEDHGSIGLSENDRYNLIDPFMFQEDDTSPWYFTFGSFWSGIQQVRMSDPLHVHDSEGDIENINNIIRNSTAINPAVVEGATTTKYGPWYFLFFSVGQCCRLEHELMPTGDEYRIAVCRAEKIEGPYYDRDGKSCVDEVGGTTILASHGDVYAPGGQGVMEHPVNGKMVLYYHYIRPSVGYAYEQFFFGWNYLDFYDGWPVVV